MNTTFYECLGADQRRSYGKFWNFDGEFLEYLGEK
jgi:hypothetical protein